MNLVTFVHPSQNYDVNGPEQECPWNFLFFRYLPIKPSFFFFFKKKKKAECIQHFRSYFCSGVTVFQQSVLKLPFVSYQNFNTEATEKLHLVDSALHLRGLGKE